jgi:hypothetical protein
LACADLNRKPVLSLSHPALTQAAPPKAKWHLVQASKMARDLAPGTTAARFNRVAQ